MFDPTTLTNLVFVAISLTAMAAILRAIGAGDPLDLGSMFAHPWEATWPRGVQEEEPRPWRLERLGVRDDAPRPDRAHASGRVGVRRGRLGHGGLTALTRRPTRWPRSRTRR